MSKIRRARIIHFYWKGNINTLHSKLVLMDKGRQALTEHKQATRDWLNEHCGESSKHIGFYYEDAMPKMRRTR